MTSFCGFEARQEVEIRCRDRLLLDFGDDDIDVLGTEYAMGIEIRFFCSNIDTQLAFPFGSKILRRYPITS